LNPVILVETSEGLNAIKSISGYYNAIDWVNLST
jgi:hypothetical protein